MNRSSPRGGRFTMNDNRFRNPMAGGGRPMGRGGMGGGFGPNQNMNQRSWSQQPQQQRPQSWQPNQAQAANKPPQIAPAQQEAILSETNDAEIAVTAKSAMAYAETIEIKLKNLGLKVDLLFPKSDVPFKKVLANIASRGTLFALLVNEEHKKNGSVSLCILYGHVQEHRNMPVEDAMIWISRNFNNFVMGIAPPIPPYPSGVCVDVAGKPLAGKHPEQIFALLKLLNESKTLKPNHIKTLIGYLDEQRNKEMQKIEEAEMSKQKRQYELQNRIMNIMNK